MSETIKTYCPFCNGNIEVESAWFGNKAQCPYCQGKFIIGSTSEHSSGGGDVPVSYKEISPRMNNGDLDGEQLRDTSQNVIYRCAQQLKEVLKRFFKFCMVHMYAFAGRVFAVSDKDDAWNADFALIRSIVQKHRKRIWKIAAVGAVIVILIDAIVVWLIVGNIDSAAKEVSSSDKKVVANVTTAKTVTESKGSVIKEVCQKKNEQRKNEKRALNVAQISGSRVCYNLSDNSLISRSKSICFVNRKPCFPFVSVRFTNDPKKADATFRFGSPARYDDRCLKLTYTYDPSRADVEYNIVDYNPIIAAETIVYIVNDETTPVDMTLCITYRDDVETINIEEPCITSKSNQQRVAIMYMLGFYK